MPAARKGCRLPRIAARDYLNRKRARWKPNFRALTDQLGPLLAAIEARLQSLMLARGQIQIVIIIGCLAAAYLLRRWLGPKLIDWMRTLEGWPKWRLRTLDSAASAPAALVLRAAQLDRRLRSWHRQRPFRRGATCWCWRQQLRRRFSLSAWQRALSETPFSDAPSPGASGSTSRSTTSA